MMSREFIAFVVETLAPLGAIQAKKMFGGYGIYHDGIMFGLVSDEVLYLKADSHSCHYFTESGMPPFRYQRQDKWVELSYYQAPEEIFDDVQTATLWAKRAFAAALKAKRA
jgi:DNA transformation protein and related proteins